MTKQEYIEQGNKVLTLQIDRECFNSIKSGKQRVEHRYVYPRNAKQYIYFECGGEIYQLQENIPDNEKEIKIIPIEYDALYLINGRRNDAPRMMIEVEKGEFYILTDEKGNDLTYMQNGVEYYVAQVWYYLKNIIFTENC